MRSVDHPAALSSGNREGFDSRLLVPGRDCGSCSLCCKLLEIEELKKPVGTWCSHCVAGSGGCTIYDERPNVCREFYCSWRLISQLGPEWQPTTAKMLILQETPDHIAVYVDPGSPTAWQREPYYGQLKAWARAGAERGNQVAVYIKKRVIAILPNKDVDLGSYDAGDNLIIRQFKTPHGMDFEASLVPSDDGGPGRQREGTPAHSEETETAGAA